MNEIIPFDPRNDGWEDAAKDAASTVIRGSILKFADWRYTHGQDGTVLPDGTRFLAVGTAHGWQRWENGKPVEYRMRQPGEQLPERSELSHTNPGDWELGFDDQPKDPWTEFRAVYFLGENATAFTFTTPSRRRVDQHF